VLCVERVPSAEISSYGVIAYEPDASLPKGTYRVTDLVEKPPVAEAPSDLAIIGRYILTPDIFTALEETAKDRTGDADEGFPHSAASSLCPSRLFSFFSSFSAASAITVPGGKIASAPAFTSAS